MARACPSCGHPNDAASKFCVQCAATLDGMVEVAPTRSGIAKPVIIAVLALGFLAVPLVLVLYMVGSGAGLGGGGRGSVQGEIRSTGQPHGDYVMQPSACYSGEHESFFGVWLAPALSEDASGRTGFQGGLKIVKTHSGEWEAYLESPVECEGFDCTIRQLTPVHCSTFSFDVQNTNNRVNRIVVRRGRADVQCEFPEGGSLSASLSFDGCS